MQTPASAAATRLRCDPTDYARRQQEKKERARDLREQRSKGVFSDDHTFSPKYVCVPSTVFDSRSLMHASYISRWSQNEPQNACTGARGGTRATAGDQLIRRHADSPG